MALQLIRQKPDIISCTAAEDMLDDEDADESPAAPSAQETVPDVAPQAPTSEKGANGAAAAKEAGGPEGLLNESAAKSR